MFTGLWFARVCILLALAFSSLILPALSSAQSPRLEAALCTQVNMVTGEFTPVSALQAGGKGFMVALTSKHDKSLTVTAVWEAVKAPGIKSGVRLGEDQVLVAPGKTKFIPFRASDGLVPGDYRILLKAAGQDDLDKAFQIKPAQSASGEKQENVSQALERAFKENKGPDAVKAGAKVMTHFFDKELGAAYLSRG